MLTRMGASRCRPCPAPLLAWACAGAALLLLLPEASGVAIAPPPTHVGYSQFLLFPQKTAGMGMFLALSVPLDSIHHDVSLSYNFEANYALPNNATQLTELEAQYGFRRALGADPVSDPEAAARRATRSLRDLARADVYAMIAGSISRAGLPGRACLLRSVCEASEWPMVEGLLGNMLTVLLTPSTSADDGELHPAFHAAERRGRRGADCAVHYKDCPVSLLGLLTEQQQ
ncbi:Arginine repressor [Frankliniella fusca]|uniref:Arginine repressor n=1 Tax=Frankliniella fusca TaxID=407009 RepID=A0AAE1I161_9NEOP|nr:Arginine repressor [Frankliniella fusca]